MCFYVIWRKAVMWLQMLSCSSLDCMNNSQPTSSTCIIPGWIIFGILCGPILKPDCCDSSQLLVTFWRGKEKETQGCLSEMKKGRRNKTVLGSYRNRPKTQWVIAYVCMWYTLNQKTRCRYRGRVLCHHLIPWLKISTNFSCSGGNLHKWSCVLNTFCKLSVLGIWHHPCNLSKGSYYLHFTVRILRFWEVWRCCQEPQLVSGNWGSK